MALANQRQKLRSSFFLIAEYALDGETGGAATEAQILQRNESRDIHMPRGAFNTEVPKNQNPRPLAQTAPDKDGGPWSLELLLLGPRFRRHKTCEAVVDNELAVVFTAMFNEAVCYVENARFLITVYDSLHQTFLAL